MATPNIFPREDAQFDIFQDNFINKVTDNLIPWGIVAGELVPLTDAQALWVAAWALAQNKDSRSSVQVKAKDIARKDYEAVLRPFIQTRIYRNKLMNDADRKLCGIRPHDKVRTPVPVPTGTPEITMQNSAANRIIFYFNQPKGMDGSSRRGKPDGVYGCIVAYKKGGDTAPASPEDCPTRVLLTRSPKVMSHDGGEAGTPVYAFTCWVNTKGEQGPWTVMIPFVIS